MTAANGQVHGEYGQVHEISVNYLCAESIRAPDKRLAGKLLSPLHFSDSEKDMSDQGHPVSCKMALFRRLSFREFFEIFLHPLPGLEGLQSWNPPLHLCQGIPYFEPVLESKMSFSRVLALPY